MQHFFLHPHNFAPWQSQNWFCIFFASSTKNATCHWKNHDDYPSKYWTWMIVLRDNDDCCGRVADLKPPWTHFRPVYHVTNLPIFDIICLSCHLCTSIFDTICPPDIFDTSCHLATYLILSIYHITQLYIWYHLLALSLLCISMYGRLQ